MNKAFYENIQPGVPLKIHRAGHNPQGRKWCQAKLSTYFRKLETMDWEKVTCAKCLASRYR